MASLKNTVVLGCFLVVCVLLFTLLNPNRHTLTLNPNEVGVFLTTDGVTGITKIIDMRVGGSGSKYWIRIPEE